MATGRKKSFGRAFPIREANLRSYEMAPRPTTRWARPNPLGVTHLSVVNGRGAYSARSVAAGKSRAERLARARALVENRSRSTGMTHRARFIRKLENNSGGTAAQRRAGRRLAAFRAAQRQGVGVRKAARSALRAVPFTVAERRRGKTFKGLKQNYRRNQEGPATIRAYPPPAPAAAAPAKARRARRTQYERAIADAERRLQKARRDAERATEKAQREKARAAERASRLAKREAEVKARFEAGREGREKRAAAKAYRAARKKVRRTYRRVKVYDPTRRSKRLSCAARFRRLQAYRAALARGLGKRKAGRAAVREVPFTKTEVARGASFVGIKAGESTVAKRRTKRKKAKAKRRRKSTKRSTTKRTKARRTRKKGRKKAKAKRRTKRTKARATKRTKGQKKARKKGKRRMKRNPYEANRRRRRQLEENRGRRYRSNRRRYRRNQGLWADLKSMLKIGFVAITGFVGHRALSGLASKFLGEKLTAKLAPDSPLRAWEKPLTGFAVGVLGVFGLSRFKAMKPETKTALGAGIMTSVLQQVVVAALTAANQTAVLQYVSGMGQTQSMAYQLRGRRGFRGLGQRGVRGLGRGHQTSIMPRYTPIGQYQQAAAGLGRLRGMGEYFASPNLQGVGAYEMAGPLAMSAVLSSVGQAPIDDGIRPDANLDNIMMLAESAAGVGQYQQAAAGLGQPFLQAAAGVRGLRGRGVRGLGRRGARGLGEYFSAQASNGGFAEYTVPTQDQWIPNGPLWAGEMSAGDSATESEIPAGILQGPGGNGILSG
jgi:hypothetical protein